mgnify:CR=1 FL=1|jgi:hypothetical protein|tara:strand:+ start:728 stop:1438 length:711 start_codon:yes stop_codon:yes gene_type:complete
MAKNKKPQKSLLNEGVIRRMMQLADIDQLSESFVSEMHSQGDDDEEDERLSMKHGAEKGKEQSYKDRRDDAGFEVRKEEDEMEAAEDEMDDAMDTMDDAEDEMDDAMDDADAGAEITPEAAQAIVDLAAQLEASGALDDAEDEAEVEAEMELSEEEEFMEAKEATVEESEDKQIDGLSEALQALGIEIVDDAADKELHESVRQRVIARLSEQKKAQEKEAKINKLADRILARLKDQ